jgi:hypothetical protein
LAITETLSHLKLINQYPGAPPFPGASRPHSSSAHLHMRERRFAAGCNAACCIIQQVPINGGVDTEHMPPTLLLQLSCLVRLLLVCWRLGDAYSDCKVLLADCALPAKSYQ